MKKTTLFILFIASFFPGLAQDKANVDTLENIIIKAYESNARLIDVPAAVSRIGQTDLNRYDNSTILQAMNTQPGVRMEQRSPGSYRLNIRGSSMRSPFGISNVKVYYDGIPYTGPGGTTDLNELGFYSIQSVEIIKGPAGSMYGAGTGGALLINNTPENFRAGFSAAYTRGSFNTNNANLNIRLGDGDANNTINYQHLNSDGYRDHTQMRRDVVSWDALLKKTDNAVLQSHFFYSDLYYQTPGALNKAEYEANPRAARPRSGIFPSAEESKAAIHDQAFFAGFSLQQKISSAWKNTSSVYGYYWHHNNPTFRNYTRRVEPNFGGRTDFQYNKNLTGGTLSVNLGGEYQHNFITSRLYGNRNGEVDTVQTDDEINNIQGFVFGQLNLTLTSGWTFTAGASFNKARVSFSRFSTVPSQNEERGFKGELAPRIAVLKKLNDKFSVYASVARGFSPPASSELLPTSGVFNTQLQAESGVDYEVGTRGSFLGSRLFIDVNVFHYQVENSIVQKQDATGGIFYDNAGSTNQNGIESHVSYTIINNPFRFLEYLSVYASDTWNNFKYKNYKQLSDDFSGNKLTGVASQSLAAGIDLSTKAGLYANLTYFYGGRIPLNDANTAFADPYNLLGVKIGYRVPVSDKFTLELFTGAENLFDETYSLGNDINAAGGRYYNAAAGRNYYAGIALRFDKK